MPNRRPRSPNADAEAAASIKQAEDMKLIPVGAENPRLLDIALGAGAREPDYRVTPPRQNDRDVPFRVKL